MTRRERQQSLAGNWPVAGPVPAIIDLLNRLLNWDHPNVMTAAERAAAHEEILQILAAWKAREDLNELRQLLGVAPVRGRRRTQHTVNREERIAYSAYMLKAEGDEDAIEKVATAASVDPKTVRRAMDRWANTESLVKMVRKEFPDARFDVATMLRNMK